MLILTIWFLRFLYKHADDVLEVHAAEHSILTSNYGVEILLKHAQKLNGNPSRLIINVFKELGRVFFLTTVDFGAFDKIGK